MKSGVLAALLLWAFPAASQTFTVSGTTPIVVDTSDYWVVNQAAAWLSADIGKVTGTTPPILHERPAGPCIILASPHSRFAHTAPAGWENFTYRIASHVLFICGSDKRGTVYGALELSRRMGVSPWHWWADVPPLHRDSLIVSPFASGTPGVKYRGIFINDEAPAFSGWTRATFGGVNHLVYEKMFELLLRLKANYLWPAMWGNAFNDDDTLNPILADKYGIVMGTSHHEPMLRAQQEWKRYGHGPWNYETNADTLRAFWRRGIQNMDHHESIVTIGMRGDGDKPMSEGSNIALLEKIVADQRRIIHEVTGKDPSEVPQDWALYKEVQDYYDKGMRVPDDVTLLLCDDNWGNIRRLPAPGSPARRGGYGMYYHFDYVGGPRNYKWLNTNAIGRVYEQMHLAYENDIRQIWVVNVGDLKPMEFPISFFLDYAWDPNAFSPARVKDYARAWAAEQFGPEHATAIGYLLSQYTFLNARRKPELLSPATYSLTHYRESERVTERYDELRTQALALYPSIPAAQRDAYFELALFPILACANLGDLYASAARNHLYIAQGRAKANDMADSVVAQFDRDSLLSNAYNHDLAGGKWDHMADQTHIGYTYWQEPRHNYMPRVGRISLPVSPLMGVSVEGSDAWWGNGAPAALADTLGGPPIVHAPFRPGDPNGFQGSEGQQIPAPQSADTGDAVLPWFNVYIPQRHYIDVFNRGTTPFTYTVTTSEPWVHVTAPMAASTGDQRIWVSVAEVPPGAHEASVTITPSTGSPVTVHLWAQGPMDGVPRSGFVENDGVVSMNADHYNSSTSTGWTRLDGVGKEGAGMTVPLKGGSLTYDFYIFDTGATRVLFYCSPTLTGKGRFAVSIDGSKPATLALPAQQEGPVWNRTVADNISIDTLPVLLTRFGAHRLTFIAVDPEVVLQKIVIDLGGLRPSYLGPPETPMRGGLKDYFRDDFPIGVAVMPHSLSGPDSSLILDQFVSVTPENVMKMRPIHPSEGRYDFTRSDSIVDWAVAHHFRVRGHNLCWHENVPDWMFKAPDGGAGAPTKAVLLQRLRDHIRTVVSRYRGRVYAWDVVNEAISDDPSQFLRVDPWYTICGEDYIKEAFRAAHEADPKAQLFYNDYNTERPEKRERVYRLLRDLVSEGIPINGVGIQGHWNLNEPTVSELRETIERFSSLGLAVQVTELDVSIYPWEKNVRQRSDADNDTYTATAQSRQATQYDSIFSVLRQFAGVITGVTFWNVSDRHTWLDNYPVPGRKNYPLLFDVNGLPKEAYWEVVEAALE